MWIDFSKCPTRNKFFNGANGEKFSIYYNNKWYLLKLSPISKYNSNLDYTYAHITEHIGSQIYKSLNIEAHNTIIGRFNGRNAVACEDFEIDNLHFSSFADFSNSVDCEKKGYGLQDVLLIIKKQKKISSSLLNRRFWDMFIVDALIGNPDRHNGNWGVLWDEKTNDVKLAPVFDCGSSLCPSCDEDLMRTIMKNEKELNKRIYERNNSILSTEYDKNKKIKYLDYLVNTDNKDCIGALKRIYPKINMTKINNIIKGCDEMTTLHKEFLSFMLHKRKELILDVAYNKQISKEDVKDHPLQR